MKTKICGITRPRDARQALAAGADFLGLVFASGARRVSVSAARRIVAQAPEAAWVGVFSSAGAGEVLEAAAAVPLRIVQLHGGEEVGVAQALRHAGLEVWQAVRVGAPPDWPAIEARLAEVSGQVDALLLDHGAAEGSGGGGVPFDWEGLTPRARQLLARGRFVLAGGLSPENVGVAIERLRPDVVDVSSGVESSAGRKDAARVRAFVRAAHEATLRVTQPRRTG